MRFRAFDGVELAYREVGEGRPLVLLHGYLSTASVNWIRYRQAAHLAARGHRVIMPDLRAHGDSARPHDPLAYPGDVLADDGLALVDHLGLADYDLGGYSLGARTTVRMLVRGAQPGRAIVAGAGLDLVTGAAARSGFFRRVLTQPGTFERGTPEGQAQAFLRNVGGDPVALLLLLGSAVDTPVAALARIATPALVVVGVDDPEHATAGELAAALGNAELATVPGNHMSAVTKPELGAAIGDFLARAG
jgi:pimeloyl-ACP methyl ester carboxylesterase